MDEEVKKIIREYGSSWLIGEYNEMFDRIGKVYVDNHLRAINYTTCCTQLKEIEERNFRLWLELNEYKIVKATYITKYGHLVDREFLWQKYVEEN